MSSRNAIRLSLVSFTLMGVGTPAVASKLPKIAFDTLYARSQLAIIGTFAGSQGEWREGRIITRHCFENVEVLHDESGRPSNSAMRCDIITLGGTVGEVGQRVSGQVSVRAECRDTALLLIQDPKSDDYFLVGRGQGLLQFECEDPTGERDSSSEAASNFVSRSLDLRTSSRDRPQDANEFRARIKELETKAGP